MPKLSQLTRAITQRCNKTLKESVFPNSINYKAIGVSKSRNPKFVGPLHYQAYVLRIWQEVDGPEGKVWRFALINATTSNEHGFSSFQELIAFLENLLEVSE